MPPPHWLEGAFDWRDGCPRSLTHLSRFVDACSIMRDLVFNLFGKVSQHFDDFVFQRAKKLSLH